MAALDPLSEGGACLIGQAVIVLLIRSTPPGESICELRELGSRKTERLEHRAQERSITGARELA